MIRRNTTGAFAPAAAYPGTLSFGVAFPAAG